MTTATVDPALKEAVGNHLRRHLGPLEGIIGEHEQTDVPVDVYVVEATVRRPFRVVVTCGMAARPMTPPGDLSGCERAELFLGLPASWPLDDLADPAAFWPIRLLKRLARFPHQGGGWLWERHVVGSLGDPPHGPGTRMNGALVAPAINLPSTFDSLKLPGAGPIRLLSVLPLHAAEVQLARQEGVNALYGAFADAEVDVVVDPGRPSSVR